MSLVIAGITLGVAAIGTGITAYQGGQAADSQKKGLVQQKQATATAQANALSTERKNATAQNQANQQSPDVSSIMAKAALAAKNGVGSTMLTGAGGTGTGILGGTTLLGK